MWSIWSEPELNLKRPIQKLQTAYYSLYYKISSGINVIGFIP